MKKVLIVVVALTVLIQLVPVDRSNPESDAALEIVVPVEVKSILERSCYDCHSNEVTWPWYSYVAPVSWLVAHDVEEGRDHINFSEWGTYEGKKQRKAKEEIWDEVFESKMPLPKYLKMHSDAVLSDDDKAIIKKWALHEETDMDSTQMTVE